MTAIDAVKTSESGTPEAARPPVYYTVPPMAADLIAGISSLVTGGLTFWQGTEERAHKNLSSLYLTEDIKNAREEFGIKLREEVKAGLKTPQEHKKLYQEAVKQFESRMDERFAKAGINNIWDKWLVLRSHQKWAVAMTTIAIGGISLGSILLLSREMFSGKKEEEPFVKKVEKESDSQEQVR